MISVPSTRLHSLSQPKLNRCEHQPRSSYTLVPLGALKFETTSRLMSLSLPRIRKENHLKTGNLFLNNEKRTLDIENCSDLLQLNNLELKYQLIFMPEALKAKN